jgi:PadR family transcriptional regulator PadR
MSKRSVKSEKASEELIILATTKRTTGDTDIFSGLIRIHVLHHASVEGVFGLGMIKELRRHGYKIGPGTMYPLLHSMEKRGWLKARSAESEGRSRKVYFATRAGKKTLEKARLKVQELFEELFEEGSHSRHDEH